MYRIIDREGGGLKKDERHATLEEVRESLFNFHSTDVEGVENMTLEDFLEVGQWAIEGECSIVGCDELREVDGTERYLNGLIVCDKHAAQADQ